MLQKPGVLLSEIQNELTSVLAVDVDVSTICRFLQASGFTRQKLQYVALQRDEFLRQKFMLDMSIYTPDMLVFLEQAEEYAQEIWLQYAWQTCTETRLLEENTCLQLPIFLSVVC